MEALTIKWLSNNGISGVTVILLMLLFMFIHKKFTVVEKIVNVFDDDEKGEKLHRLKTIVDVDLTMTVKKTKDSVEVLAREIEDITSYYNSHKIECAYRQENYVNKETLDNKIELAHAKTDKLISEFKSEMANFKREIKEELRDINKNLIAVLSRNVNDGK